ncbi:hydrolase, NUDIX family, putative [Verrucomicrobiia bacterium DG1235]|nr:hydrolase, NUDIX family, putative [Verrucomicrobiae bacterium DG1235]
MSHYQIGVFAITKKQKVVLITSRTGARWIFPKGQPEKGRRMEKIAAEEAFEEAGIRGTIKSRPHSFKVTYGRTQKLFLYYMRVEDALDIWPESKERKRVIVSIDEAEKLLGKDLRSALRSMRKSYLK